MLASGAEKEASASAEGAAAGRCVSARCCARGEIEVAIELGGRAVYGTGGRSGLAPLGLALIGGELCTSVTRTSGSSTLGTVAPQRCFDLCATLASATLSVSCGVHEIASDEKETDDQVLDGRGGPNADVDHAEAICMPHHN